MAREKKKFKWEPTQKVKPPDSIKSSDYSNAKPFIPSYETEKRPQMGQLLSMEYARMWHNERDQLKKIESSTKVPPKKFNVQPTKKKKDLKGENKENLKKAVHKENVNLKKEGSKSRLK